MSEKIKAVILAAGKGKRLQTEGCDLPKVMRLANGKPLLGYVLDALRFVPKQDTIIVAGYKKEYVMRAFPDYPFAEQKEMLGTGHAVMSAADALRDFDGPVLICCGDMPLLRSQTYEAMVQAYKQENCACVILTGTSDVDLPFGRVVRDEKGEYQKIVEERDCTPEQLAITELNAGVYVFDCQKLLSCLGELRCDNAQGEYYLTDVPEIMMQKNWRVVACKRELGTEIIGVNTVEQLQTVERVLQKQ